MNKLSLTLLFVFSFMAIVFGQEKEYVFDAFSGTRLINTQTTQILRPKSWGVSIQHRFGKVGIDEKIITDFLGMDLPATMRLALGFNFTKNLFIGIGRTNHYKTYDIEGKYILKRQIEEEKFPISIAIYGNMALKSDKFPRLSENAYFSDNITPFQYQFKHRLSYITELVMSSKISERVSITLTPIFVYDNLVAIEKENYTAAISFGGRFKYGFSSSIIWEYSKVLNNRTDDFRDPLSLGLEFGTLGHVFQIFLSSNSDILENRIYTNGSNADYTKGDFLLGFNIQRRIWIK